MCPENCCQIRDPIRDYESLAHTRWDCKYHVVFIPKKRRKVIYGKLRRNMGEIFHELAGRKGVKVVEGHLMPDHIHMRISIPPKYSVSNVVGYLKGKSAIAIARQVREYIRNQEKADEHRDQLRLGMMQRLGRN